MATSYRCLFRCNTIKEEGDGSLLPLPFFFLKHREEGDGSSLPSPSSLQQ